MQEMASQQRWPDHSGEIDGEARLKQVLYSLKSENNQLRSLVVRLSETIIKNVAARR